jgi:type I restriction enzyme S subunit
MTDVTSTSATFDRSDLPVLPADWRWVPFSETCDRVSVGHVGPTTQFFTDAPDGICFLRSQNVRPGKLELGNALSITPDFHKKLKKSQLRAGDILFVRVGANRGDCCVVPSGLGELNCANIVFARPKQPTGFHAFFFQSALGRNLLLSASVGSAQGVINTGSVATMPVPLPPLSIQHRIAGILSAYDELIENNQRRIKILQSMARTLYREWFVHFRFPGHENHPRVASPVGEIPEGWEVKTVADSFAISGGGTPSRKDDRYWEGGQIQWYSPSDLTGDATMFMDDSSDHITELGLAESSARLFPPQSVMLTSRATIGAVAINTCEACTNQGFITCLPNERVPLYFLFHWVTENVPTFQRMASGATFKEISRGVFKTIEFVHPPAKLVRHFEDASAPIAEQVLTLQRRVTNLRRTRDLLLPRLLSGQLNVGED